MLCAVRRADARSSARRSAPNNPTSVFQIGEAGSALVRPRSRASRGRDRNDTSAFALVDTLQDLAFPPFRPTMKQQYMAPAGPVGSSRCLVKPSNKWRPFGREARSSLLVDL